MWRLAGPIASLVALIAAVPVYGQTHEDVSLVIRFANGSNQFKVGQVIPIELAFSTSTPNRYSFNTASYDRSGRLGEEQFEVNPKGRDPLSSYYGDPLQNFVGGGLFGSLVLDKVPQVIQENLNEWVALDKPGHYTLRVTSYRVSGANHTPNSSASVVSNIVDFDIAEADPAWRRQTLWQAMATLDNARASEEQRTAAEQALRYLDSPESVRELARRLTKPGYGDGWNFTAGLLGASNQDLVLEELEARFTAPEAALTQDYLWLLGRMEFARTHAPLPPYPRNDAAEQKIWQAKRESIYVQLGQADDALCQRAADSLALKRGAAKASTIATILVRPDGPHKAIGLPEADIAAALPLLDEKQQATVLDYFSSRITGPSMAAPLEAILDKPTLSAGSMLRINALDKLLNVSPERGRVRILAEIRQPHADGLDSLNYIEWLAICLSSLPEETLPELNDLLANRLEQRDSPTRDLDAQLIGRYSTAVILNRVRGTYRNEVGSWDCVAEDGFIKYFLRVDQDYRLSVLKGEGSSCTKESLNEVARLKRWLEVQPVFIQRLNDSDMWRAGDAAEVLGQWGDSTAKQALLLRLRAFHEAWKDRFQKSRQRPSVLVPPAVNDAMFFQSALIQALAQAKGWSLTEDEKTELKNLTGSASGR